MKLINPLLRKVLVELKGLEYSLVFWWDDQMIEDFEKILERKTNETVRAHNTPNSVVEFNLNVFKSFSLTPVTELILSNQGWHLTNIFLYYQRLELLPPIQKLNSHFEFPNTLICYLNKKTNASILLDISNQITLDNLISSGFEIQDFCKSSLYSQTSISNPLQVLFAEYSFRV